MEAREPQNEPEDEQRSPSLLWKTMLLARGKKLHKSRPFLSVKTPPFQGVRDFNDKGTHTHTHIRHSQAATVNGGAGASRFRETGTVEEAPKENCNKTQMLPLI